MAPKNLRQWWQRPRSLNERSDDRNVSFLELFYDLVYVALIAQISHDLAERLTEWEEILRFISIYFLVWWAWLNGTLYHELHGNDDLRTRVLTFVQMIVLIAMAIFEHEVFGPSFVAFSLSYAFFLAILGVLWWRTGVHDPAHRPLSTPYAWMFGVMTALFVASAWVEWEIGYLMWVVAILLSVVVPFANAYLPRHDEATRRQIELSTEAKPSLVERMGLLTIMVLGEVVVGIVAAAAEQPMQPRLGLQVLLATLIAIAIWWLYFDLVSHRRPQKGRGNYALWLYAHLPITLAIVFIGSSLKDILLGEGQAFSQLKDVLLISVAVWLVCVVLLVESLPKTDPTYRRIAQNAQLTMLLASGLLLTGMLVTVSPLVLLAGVVFLLFLPIVVSLITWLNAPSSPPHRHG